MLLFHKQKLIWTSQQIDRCILLRSEEERKERIQGLIESEESSKANPSVSTLEPHRKCYCISPASHRNWNGKRDRDGCSLPLFHPLTLVKSLFFHAIFPKSLDYFQQTGMNERTVFEDMVSIISFIQKALRELTRKLEKHIKTCYFPKTNIQKSNQVYRGMRERKKEQESFQITLESKTSQFLVSFSLSSNLLGVSIITAAKK